MSLETDIQTAYEEQEAVEMQRVSLNLVSERLTVQHGLCQRVLTVNPSTVTLLPSH